MKNALRWALILWTMPTGIVLGMRSDNPRFGPYSSAAWVLLLGVLSVFIFIVFCLAVSDRYPRQVGNACLLLSSIVISFLFLDHLAWRILDPLSRRPVLKDPIVHHRVVGDRYDRSMPRGPGSGDTFNPYSYREPFQPTTKEAGVYRIAMLGDSFTMGVGVNQDETFSFRTQTSLNAEVPWLESMGLAGVEVINFGMVSYSPILSYLQMKLTVAPYDPDLVVMNLDMSDLAQEKAYRRSAVYDASGDIVAVRPEEDVSGSKISMVLHQWIMHRLFVTRYFYVWLRKALHIYVPSPLNEYSKDVLAHTLAGDSTDRSEEWELLFDGIRRIRNYCLERGIGFVMTVYPWGHQVSDREWVPNRFEFIHPAAVVSDRSVRTIETFCQDEKIPLLNVFDRFRAYHGPQLLYFKHDLHWTPRGHALMEEALTPFLRESIQKRLELGKEA